LKKAIVAFLKVLYQYSSSKTEEDHGNPSGCPII
jgi:hypothetical protein